MSPPPAYDGPPPPSAGMPQLAGWGSRAGALIIDALIAGIPGGIIGAAVSSGLGNLVQLGITLWLLYQQGTTGQTIGKKALNIKLLREADGQVVGVGTSIGRYLLHILDSLPLLLGWLWPLWDAKKQTFADKIMKTVVVRA
jgi:uncharacterized RDD family membrane protein YckC